MTAITYTAQRSLVSGHSADTVYSFDVKINRYDRSTKAEKSPAVSLSGVTETIFHRLDEFRDISTPPLTGAVSDQMIEFLDSVAAGETFSIDFTGTVAVPVSSESFIIDGDYNQDRLPLQDVYTYSFRAKKL